MHKIVNPQQTRFFNSFGNILTEKIHSICLVTGVMIMCAGPTSGFFIEKVAYSLEWLVPQESFSKNSLSLT